MVSLLIGGWGASRSGSGDFILNRMADLGASGFLESAPVCHVPAASCVTLARGIGASFLGV